ncbi:hypothetical protein, partial [Wenzhouxiangella sediminis]|uniref:hypothetical protein n=1 Tax=Wenzhouxiangella sediminis TaxID=1792836 RepID=UPI001C6E8040
FRFQVSGFRFQVSGFRFQVSGGASARCGPALPGYARWSFGVHGEQLVGNETPASPGAPET